MKIKNYRGESLISIIIVVVIIIIIVLSLIKIMELDGSIDSEFKNVNNITLLEGNTYKLVNKINTQNLIEKDIFYIYKTGSEIKIFTGSSNEKYKLINFLGENVNENYKGKIYSRFCLLESDSSLGQNIKCSVKEMIKK